MIRGSWLWGSVVVLAARDADVVLEQLDVLDGAELAALAQKYRGEPIDLLINNAGVLGSEHARNLSPRPPVRSISHFNTSC